MLKQQQPFDQTTDLYYLLLLKKGTFVSFQRKENHCMGRCLIPTVTLPRTAKIHNQPRCQKKKKMTPIHRRSLFLH